MGQPDEGLVEWLRRWPAEFVGAVSVVAIVATGSASVFAPVGWIVTTAVLSIAAIAAAVWLSYPRGTMG